MTPDFNQPPQLATQDSPYSTKGRFGRLSYLTWLFITNALYSSIALFIVFLFGLVAFATSAVEITDLQSFFFSTMGIITGILFLIAVIGSLILTVKVTIRRLHDLDKNGWLCLLFLIPFVNVLFALYILCAPGTKGPNRYGPVRATEQTEKFIGFSYCILIGLAIIFNAASFIFFPALYSQFDHLQQEYSLSDDDLSQPDASNVDESSTNSDDAEQNQSPQVTGQQRTI